MLEHIDCIYILKLKKNNAQESLDHVQKRFPKTSIRFYEVDGITTNRNEGSINLSIWKIMSHDYVDDIALDITKNHIGMIREAYMKDHQRVLFLEEDARFEENVSQQKCKRVDAWLSTKTKWDIFYLGYCNWPMLFSFFITRDIIRLYTPLAAHSYILNRRGMQKILNYTENGNRNMSMHIDKMFTKIPNFHKYAIFPMISFQDKDPALYTKAIDKMNLNVRIKTCCRVIEYLSLILPMLFVCLMVFLLMRLLWNRS